MPEKKKRKKAKLVIKIETTDLRPSRKKDNAV